MTAGGILALGLALAGGADDAEDLFRRFEERLSKAAALTWRFRATGDFFGEVHAGQERVQGQKYRVDYSSRASGEKWTERFDGTRRAVHRDEKEPLEPRVLPGLGVFLVGALRRGSVGEAYTALLHRKNPEKAPDPAEAFKVEGPAGGREELLGDRRALRLDYTLVQPGEKPDAPEKAAVRLWIDPETLAPLRRDLVSDSGAKLTETYGDLSTEKIDDAEFRIP
jgi:hypothetical protein